MKNSGKGDKPRNCFSKQFKDHYDLIDWSKNKEKEEESYARNNKQPESGREVASTKS